MLSQSKKLLPILLFFISHSLFAETNDGFIFQDKPINPACVSMFNASEADYPYLMSINLNVCQNSNAAYQTTYKNKDGSYYFYVNNKDNQEGIYEYKVIGKTNNGIYVVDTSSSGGGTLVANDLLLIRLIRDNQYVYDSKKNPIGKVENITEMKLLGYVLGGDRCAGGFSDTKVIGNKIITKQYESENPHDCNKTKDVSIDLGNVN